MAKHSPASEVSAGENATSQSCQAQAAGLNGFGGRLVLLGAGTAK